jgi:hypothetical protein
MEKQSVKCLCAISALLAGILLPATAKAGTVILEGSDAIGLHCDQENIPTACLYESQTWKALDGSSALPIAAIGNVTLTSQGSGITIDNFGSVAGAGGLAQYAALYFTALNGCCSENDAVITAPGAQAAVAAYLAGGGTVMIENYTGDSNWDFAVGTSGNGNAHIAGFLGSLGGPVCDDGETVTATGIANGFTQPGIIGCWTHQAYQESFFGPLGFTKNFFDSGAVFQSLPGAPFSSLLSNGVTQTGKVPEPASFVLIVGSIAGLGLLRLKRSRKA